jgi:dephospho-CoA kinase
MSNQWPDKYVIGLTGNIATGKSAVLKMAADKGAFALDADKIVHQLLDGDRSVQAEVVSQFGEHTRLPDGRIDREAIAKVVFDDEAALVALESIIHPAVQNRIYSEIAASNKKIIFIEAIKLLEGELADICQEIWVTRCPKQLQIQRLVTIREMDQETAESRINAQSPQSKKIAFADVVIDTAGSITETRWRFELAWSGMVKRVDNYFEHVSQDNYSSTAGNILSVEPEQDYDPEHVSQFENEAEDWPFAPHFENSEINIRRAHISDAEQLASFINNAIKEKIEVSGSDVIEYLSDHGYLMAKKDGKPRAIIGWWTENLVAVIDQMLIDNPDEVYEIGGSLLREILQTANELICESILAYLKYDDPMEYHKLYTTWGFKYVDPKSLPQVWQPQMHGKIESGNLLMLKTLRKTQHANFLYISREEALAQSW